MPNDPQYIVQEQAAHIDRLQREIEQLKLDKSSLTGQLREAGTSKGSSSVSIKREEGAPSSSLSASSSSTSGSKKRARTSDSPIQPAEASTSTPLPPGDRLLQLHRDLKSLDDDNDELCSLINVRGVLRTHPMVLRQQDRVVAEMKALRKEIYSIIFPGAEHKFDNDGLAHVCGIEHVPIEKRYYLRYERDEEE